LTIFTQKISNLIGKSQNQTKVDQKFVKNKRINAKKHVNRNFDKGVKYVIQIFTVSFILL